MSRTVATWIEVPQTAPVDGLPRPRRARPRAVRLTLATVPERRAAPVAHALPIPTELELELRRERVTV
jgi:hypothetical protein